MIVIIIAFINNKERVCVRACVHACVHACVCACAHVRVCMHACMHVHVCFPKGDPHPNPSLPPSQSSSIPRPPDMLWVFPECPPLCNPHRKREGEKEGARVGRGGLGGWKRVWMHHSKTMPVCVSSLDYFICKQFRPTPCLPLHAGNFPRVLDRKRSKTIPVCVSSLDQHHAHPCMQAIFPCARQKAQQDCSCICK